MKDIGGSVVLGESGPMGHDDDRRPMNEWTPRRIGFNAPPTEAVIRRDSRAVHLRRDEFPDSPNVYSWQSTSDHFE